MQFPEKPKTTWPNHVGSVLRSSWISLLIITLIVLLTNLDQSDTIVVDLLDNNPVNLLLFLFLVFLLTMVLSHYPVYLEYNQNNRMQGTADSLSWNIREIVLGFGFITFTDQVFDSKSKLSGHLRNIWGLFLLTAVFYLLVVVHTRNVAIFEEDDANARFWQWFQVCSYALISLLTYFLANKLLSTSDTAKPEWSNEAIRKSNDRKKRNQKILINSTLVLFLGVLGILLWYSVNQGWSKTTYAWFYVVLYAAIPFYVFFRSFRKNTMLGQDLTFLMSIAAGGFLSLLLIILAHRYVFCFNPLVILLSQFIIIYGLVVIPIKHHFYYRQEEVYATLHWGKKFFFVWFWPFSLPIFFLLAFIAGKIGNDLHELPPIAEQSNQVVTFDQFVKDFDHHFQHKKTIYLIASFGGGLKANIWNQLIFERLSNYGGENILSSTVAISGVSGGAIGHAVFGGLYKKYGPSDSTKKLRSEIRKLADRNFVSLDLAYLLGKDLLLELVPGFLYPRMSHTQDRAKRAMQEYSDFVMDGDTMLTKSYRAYWARLYQSEKAKGNFFPAFIANAAGTHIQRGIACSVKMRTGQFDSTFFDSTDLLTFTDSSQHERPVSLPYLYAASCTNRFPIFSPAAKVNQKGHFIDGGYFENSGMLSLLDFYEKLKKASSLFSDTARHVPPKVVFIQIINGRDEYLKSLTKRPFKKRIKESSELASILGTVASISFVPSYLMVKNAMSEQQRVQATATGSDTARVRYAQIHLPYFVTEKDLKKLLKLKEISLDPATLQQMKASNAMVKKMVQSNVYEYMQPPLARLLGKQAANYMNAALDQQRTWEDLNRVLQ